MQPSPDTRVHALTQMVSEQQRALAHFAWTCLAARGAKAGPEDVEDVLSDAYLKAATRLSKEPGLEIENFNAWFHRIVFFDALHHARRWRGREWERGIAELEREAETQTELHALQGGSGVEDRILARQLLERLGEEDREIVRLSLEGYSSEEMADRVGTSAAAVRQRKSRALHQLREALETSK